MKTRVWLSYDLGVSGDYDSLYFWLDEHEALECGVSIATFLWENTGDIKTEIKESLQKDIQFKKTSRVYLVFKKRTAVIPDRLLLGSAKQVPGRDIHQSPQRTMNRHVKKHHC